MSDRFFTIEHQKLRLQLAPSIGGAVSGFWYEGIPVWRSPADALDNVRASACYPLIPYSNRIAFGQFNWHGKDHQIKLNFGDHPHPLHGVGWKSAWEVASIQADSATLILDHRANEHWPFNFLAHQTFALNDKGLTLCLGVTNIDKEDQPMGLGWHPYFVRRSQSFLDLPVCEQWISDDRSLPLHAIPMNGLRAKVANINLDNCFHKSSGDMVIEDEVVQCTLKSALDYVVVFTPPDRDFFAVEPVSHLNNAINRAPMEQYGLRTLAPNESWEVSMQLSVSLK